MKALILGIFGLFSLVAYTQTKPTHVYFNIDFETAKNSQLFINGVLFDGRNYYPIRQGKGETLLYPGEHQFETNIAVTGNPEAYKTKLAPVKVKGNDTITIDVKVPDSYLPHFSELHLVPYTGKFYASNISDTLNCIDLQGKKHGLWFEQEHQLENCIDYLIYHYQLFYSDTLKYTLDFKFDYNACFVMDYILELSVYDPQGKISYKHLYTIDRGYGLGMQPDVNTSFDHHHFKKTDAIRMMDELMKKGTNDFVPFFLSYKRVNGVYEFYRGDQLQLKKELNKDDY